MLNNPNLKSIPSINDNLEELDLSGCDIHFLPDNFFNHCLQKVDLKGMKNLKTIPCLNDFLAELDVSECDLLTLPDDLFQHKLQRIYMRENTGEATDRTMSKIFLRLT